jgi:hypothetical protein
MRRLITVLVLMSAAALAQRTAPPIRPILRLEKPKYVLGESIRFWEGLEVTKADHRIPAELIQARTPCSLTITNPDSTKESQTMEWPVDGDISHGWIGAASLKAGMTGTYTLVLTCSGISSPPLALPVEENSILKKIKVNLRFEKSGDLRRYASVPVIFTVRNDSSYPIRFPVRAAIVDEGVYLHVVRHNPDQTHDLSYPADKLTHAVVRTLAYTFRNADRIPSETLVPGGHLEQRLYLDDVFKFDEPGEYQITISTVLSILVGDSNGHFKDISPIRIPAEQSATFAIAQ